MKRLVTFLGTGKYEATNYRLEDRNHSTRYVADAIARLERVDQVWVLATPEAREAHEEGLRQALPDPNAFRVMDIPTGRNEGELWQQFEAIRKAITSDQPQSVILDITHGFRAQPFFAAASLGLLNASGRLPEAVRVVYGEFRKEEAESPIWDLTLFLDLLSWTQGTTVLMQTGNGQPLVEVLRRHDRNLRRDLASRGERNFPQTDRLINAIQSFTDDLATVRVASLITGYAQNDKDKAGVVSSAQALTDAVRDYRRDADVHLPALVPLLENLEQMSREISAPNLHGEEGHRAMGQLAQKYLDFQRYPEAAIVVREGYVSHYADSPEAVEVNSREFNNSARKQADDDWKVGNEHLAESIGDVRNDIEHGGFRKQPLSAKRMMERINTLVQGFRKIGKA